MLRGEELEPGLYAHYDATASATLAVSDQKTGGFFDLVKSMQETGPDEGPDRRAVYEWGRRERFPDWVAY